MIDSGLASPPCHVEISLPLIINTHKPWHSGYDFQISQDIDRQYIQTHRLICIIFAQLPFILTPFYPNTRHNYSSSPSAGISPNHKVNLYTMPLLCTYYSIYIHSHSCTPPPTCFRNLPFPSYTQSYTTLLHSHLCHTTASPNVPSFNHQNTSSTPFLLFHYHA